MLRDKILHIRISGDFKAKADEAAKADRRTLSAWVEMLMAREIEAREAKAEPTPAKPAPRKK